MTQDKPVELDILRSFSPLDGLKRENLHALAKKTRLQELDAGRVLFKEGDSDKRTVYLVGGELELRVGDRTISMLRAGHSRGPHRDRARPAAALHRARPLGRDVRIDRFGPARRHDHLGPDRAPMRSARSRAAAVPMATTG